MYCPSWCFVGYHSCLPDESWGCLLVADEIKLLGDFTIITEKLQYCLEVSCSKNDIFNMRLPIKSNRLELYHLDTFCLCCSRIW